jgi:DNA-binding transcriptional regulator YiaG
VAAGEAHLAAERGRVFAARVASFVDVRKLATAFEVSSATVNRWASGAPMPHPLVVEHVLKYIATPCGDRQVT